MYRLEPIAHEYVAANRMLVSGSRGGTAQSDYCFGVGTTVGTCLVDILVNATTLVKGGGIQVAASFISEAEASAGEASGSIRWHYAVSPQIAAEIDVPSDRVHMFRETPAKSSAARQQLVGLAERLDVSAVFTVFNY